MKKTSSDLLLLDVNVLLSLAWPNHQFHASATRRFKSKQERWATCAITQLGFIRLSSNPAAVSPVRTPAEAASLLQAMVADEFHIYIRSMPSPLEISQFERILGSAQVTDAYLLALARSHDARFVTFDRRLAGLVEDDTMVELLGA